MGGFPIQRQRFHRPMRLEHDGAAGGFIATARFHPDIAVFHDVRPTDAVRAAQLVQAGQYGGGRQRLAVDRHDVAVTVAQFEIKRLVGGLFRRHRPTPHRLIRLAPWVFQHAALVGNVQEIRIHRIRRFRTALHLDRDAVLLGVSQQFLAREQIPFPPRRDDLDVGFEGVSAQFEPHLIVALAGRAVRYGVRSSLYRDLDLALGDQRPGDGRSQQVFALVDRVGPKHGEHEIAHEFLAQILDVDVFRLDPKLQRLTPRRLQFLALAEIGGKGHDLAVIHVLQPLQDDRGIQAARIGQHDFFDIRHNIPHKTKSGSGIKSDPAASVSPGRASR